ncbi:hypothetical protein CBR_g37936 [Chara braunii]|uniref:Arb2 domain-containing protein n=1 Tax=Chara braunii TaxID=69332 RepID=A0A388LP60_CHABU|nr:hypothetical protein CBR_g37936 [Chara braunii]|eukprot:GBG84061.1 hypothetical protein CBR_g37936 [Chara braunii]
MEIGSFEEPACCAEAVENVLRQLKNQLDVDVSVRVPENMGCELQPAVGYKSWEMYWWSIRFKFRLTTTVAAPCTGLRAHLRQSDPEQLCAHPKPTEGIGFHSVSANQAVGSEILYSVLWALPQLGPSYAAPTKVMKMASTIARSGLCQNLNRLQHVRPSYIIESKLHLIGECDVMELSAGEVIDLLFEEVASHCAAMGSEIHMAEGIEGEDLSVKWPELERNDQGSADNHVTTTTPSSVAGCGQVETKKTGVDVPLAGFLCQDHLLKLSFFFNKNLDRALQILDAGGVEWVKGVPSGRSVFRIWGVKAKGVVRDHLCFPLSYCTCESFFYDVVARTNYIQELMVKSYDMICIKLPLAESSEPGQKHVDIASAAVDSGWVEECEEETKCPIFVSTNSKTADILLVVLCSGGKVQAGQWSRKLCMLDSLNKGTVLPYLDWAYTLGMGVVVLNPNVNYVRHEKGMYEKIPNNSTPEEHVLCVWDQVIQNLGARHIVILAHSFGGVLLGGLLRNRCKEVLQRVRCVALADSVHGFWKPQDLPEKARFFFVEHCANWVASKKPLGTILAEPAILPEDVGKKLPLFHVKEFFRHAKPSVKSSKFLLGYPRHHLTCGMWHGGKHSSHGCFMIPHSNKVHNKRGIDMEGGHSKIVRAFQRLKVGFRKADAFGNAEKEGHRNLDDDWDNCVPFDSNGTDRRKQQQVVPHVNLRNHVLETESCCDCVCLSAGSTVHEETAMRDADVVVVGIDLAMMAVAAVVVVDIVPANASVMMALMTLMKCCSAAGDIGAVPTGVGDNILYVQNDQYCDSLVRCIYCD